MKNRKCFYLLILIIIILNMFSGCSTNVNSTLLIISSPDNKTINYYEYSIVEKNNKKIYSTNKTCYSTATLSKDNQILYFTRSDKNKFPQLFQVNLNTSEEKQLTSKEENNIINVDFLKINYNKDLIYLRVVQENHRNFSLAIYNIKSNELKILDDDEKDLSNQFFDFSNSSNSILTFQNSEQEKFNIMDEANKSKKFGTSPNNNIVIKDDNGKDDKVYNSIKNTIVDVSLSPDKKSTIILTSEIVDISNHEFKKQILLKDLHNDDETKSILSTGEFFEDIKKVCFSKDGKGFYFVAKEASKQYNLYYYELDNKSISLILTVDNENILDCTLMSK